MKNEGKNTTQNCQAKQPFIRAINFALSEETYKTYTLIAFRELQHEDYLV